MLRTLYTRLRVSQKPQFTPFFLLAALSIAVGLLVSAASVPVFAAPRQQADLTDAVNEALGDDAQEPTDVVDPVVKPVDTLEGVRDAVVQIEALSELTLDPESALLASVIIGQGSGFIVDPSGLAVTNSQVLGGAQFLKVSVAGESLPRKAKVVSVSECENIALIDIQGDEFAYLDWFEGPVRFGLEIYAAGYLQDEPERPLYSLLEGVVLNASASAPDRQTAVHSVVQHSSPSTEGKAGGPLLDRSGKVLGMNYLPADGRSYALSRDELVAAVEQMFDGVHLSGIGITSEPAIDEDGMTEGLRVLAVLPNRPAAAVGIKSGDILTSIAGNPLVSTNPLGVYCATLSVLESSDIIPLEVKRSGVSGTLVGQINGQSLDSYFSFTDAIGEPYPQFGRDADATRLRRPGLVESVAESTVAFASVRDPSNLLSVQIPREWDKIDAGEWQLDGRAVGVQLTASTDIDSYYYEQSVPGIFAATSLGLINLMTRNELLDTMSYQSTCEYVDRFPLPSGYLNGAYDIWENCGETDRLSIVLAASPITREYLLLMQTYVESVEDLTTFDRAWSTFTVNVPQSNQRSAAFDSTLIGENIEEIVVTDGLEYSFEFVENETISALLPDGWQDTDDEKWVVEDEEVGTIFYASPNLDAYRNTWTTPGVLIRSSSSLGKGITPDDVLDSFDYSQYCDTGRRLEHRHSIYGINYAGAYDMWFNCGGQQNWLAVMAVENDQTDQLLMVEFRNVELADAEAFRVLIDSMYFYTDELKQSYTAQSGRRATVEQPSVRFVEVTDDTGLISIAVPEEWDEQKTADWNTDELSGTALNVSADLAQYSRSWSEPGVFVAVSVDSTGLPPESLIDQFDFSDVCELETRVGYDDRIFEGAYNQWTACDGTDNDFIVLAASSQLYPQVMVLLNVSVSNDEAGEEIVHTILHSISVVDDELDLDVPVADSSLDEEPETGSENVLDEDAAEGDRRVASAATRQPTDDSDSANDEESAEDESEDEPTLQPTEDSPNLPTRSAPTATPRATVTRRSTSTPDTPTLDTPTLDTPTLDTPTRSATSTPTPEEINNEANSEVNSNNEANNVLNGANANQLPPPLAVVSVGSLNVRSGPGLEYAPIAVALDGQQLQVVGESGACRWLQIVREDGSLAWVSGVPPYIRFNTPCSVVQDFQFTVPDEANAFTASGSERSESSDNEAGEGDAEAGVEPQPIDARTVLGCFVFQNPLSVTVNITLSDSNGVGSTFEVPRRSDYEQCFEPDDYTYTLDAPPPWESTNGQISIGAGEQLIFQIRPESLN